MFLIGLVSWLGISEVSADEPVSMLQPGQIVQRNITVGEQHDFKLRFSGSKTWRVDLEQLDIDLALELRFPDHQEVWIVDSPQGRDGSELMLIELLDESGGKLSGDGEPALAVRPASGAVGVGRYRLRLEAVPASVSKAAVAADRDWTQASRLWAESRSVEDALVLVDRALSTRRALKDLPGQAETLFLRARLLDAMKDRRRAEVSYQETVGTWRSLAAEGSPSVAGFAAALDYWGRSLFSLGRFVDALPALQEALSLRVQLGQVYGAVETRNRLCLVRQRMGDWAEARICYETTLHAARAIGDQTVEADVLNNLGGLHSNLGQPVDALKRFHQGLAVSKQLDDLSGEAIALHNLGFLHRGLGELEQALVYYDRALRGFRDRENTYWQARTLSNMGRAHQLLGNFQRAESYLLQALALRRQVGDRSGEAATLRNLARTYRDLDSAPRALAFAQKALDSSLQRQDDRGSATAYQLLGSLHLEWGDPASARQAFGQALELQRAIGNRPHEAQSLEGLARIELAEGRSEEAARLAQQALDLYRQVSNPLGEINALMLLAQVDRDTARFSTAPARFEDALRIAEASRDGLGDPSQRASLMASQRAIYESYADLLIQLHRMHPERGHDRDALEISERARSRSLLDLLDRLAIERRNVADSGPQSSLQVETGQLEAGQLEARQVAARRNLTAKTQRRLKVLAGRPDPQQVQEADQDYFAALSELEAVRAELRGLRSGAHDRPAGDVLTVEAMQSLLDSETVLLEFLLGERRSFLWWVTSDGLEVYELPPRSALEAEARRLREQLGHLDLRTGKTEKTAAITLGRMLLGPVASRLRHQRLAIIPDGALHYLPFAALGSPAAEIYSPIVEDHEVVYLPSGSVLAAQRQAARTRVPAKKTLALLADPIFNEWDERLRSSEKSGVDASEPARRAQDVDLAALPRLPETRKEAQVVASRVAVEQRLVALGAAANRQQVIGQNLRDFRILHFATHGLIHARAPELSGIVLSQLDAVGQPVHGFLTLRDVADLELSAELVVLSGCQTALGREIRGEGLMGLSRGFMVAGVPKIIASLWQIQDIAGAELMGRFYGAYLDQNQSPAAALRQAQLEQWRSSTRNDPFYWSAFILTGDWR